MRNFPLNVAMSSGIDPLHHVGPHPADKSAATTFSTRRPHWTGGRQVIEDFETELRQKGWGINREVLLRIMSVLKVGSPNHIRLLELKDEREWVEAWEKMQNAVRDAIGFFQDDANILGRSLLPTDYVVLLPAVFLHDRKGQFRPGETNELACWLFLASAFGHYSGSLETTSAADVTLLRNKETAGKPEETLPALIRAAQEPRTPGTYRGGSANGFPSNPSRPSRVTSNPGVAGLASLQLTASAHTMCTFTWPFDVDTGRSLILPRCSVVRFFVDDHAAGGNRRREV